MSDISTKRHSLSHILASAVKELYPSVRLGIGPAIENGFYYDFEFKAPLEPEELKKIEKKMIEIINKKLAFEKSEASIAEAEKQLKGEGFKLELLKDLASKGEKTVSFYTHGDFTDMCAGPHIANTSEIKTKSWKLEKLAGAYWRGSEKNPMLTRIYALAFETAEELTAYEKMMEEAKKRDHRVLGQKLELFDFHEEGAGFPFWHAKGVVLWNNLIDYWREEHKKAGYGEIKTPIILNEKLWKQSGHWDHYRENMYFTTIDEEVHAVKPMNCPGGMLVYKSRMHSYREMPIRAGELGLVHRHEKSGVLHGLFRVRSFTQDDAHIFCTPEQVESEIEGVVQLAKKFYDKFGFEFRVELSTRPDNSIGEDSIWELAESTLEKVIKGCNIPYSINPGDGAFYGPKLDFHLKDAIGRTWQCGTVQLDFAMPERFELEYTGADGEKHRPVMLHRVIYGSIERFIGILTEHYAAEFPVWLAPVQVKILPVGEKYNEYAKEVAKLLEESNLRVEVDESDESLGKKVRNAETEKVPRILVVGEEEQTNKSVAVRVLHVREQENMSVENFIAQMKELVQKRA